MVRLISLYLIYEVANALRYNPDLGENQVIEARGYLGDLQLRLRLMDAHDNELVTSIAFRHGLTICDSSYFALAEGEACEIYTADEKSLAKIGQSSRFRHILDYIPER